MVDNKWLLDFQGVQIARHEHILFEHLDLQIAAGEFVYLTGPVGAGKSTLLKTISAEVPLTKGKATVMGFDLTRIKSKDLPKLRRRLSFRTSSSYQTRPCTTTSTSCSVPSVSAAVASVRAASTKLFRTSVSRRKATNIPTSSLVASNSV